MLRTLEQIDSSSGAIGSAVYVAIEELVPIIASGNLSMFLGKYIGLM